VPPPTNHDTTGMERRSFVVKEGWGGRASDMGLRTSFRAEGMNFRGASMAVIVDGVEVDRRLGWERERRVD
jgi:hypothetical protein